MVARSPAPYAIIEVTRNEHGELRMDVVRAAYGLSLCGRVALALRDVSTAEVDRALDTTVRENGCAVAGIIYTDASDDNLVRTIAAGVRFAVASTDAFRRQLIESGATVLSQDDVAEYLTAQDAEGWSRRHA